LCEGVRGKDESWRVTFYLRRRICKRGTEIEMGRPCIETKARIFKNQGCGTRSLRRNVAMIPPLRAAKGTALRSG
jgi:hypothetical protein